MPTSAVRSAGASFTPSPTIATYCRPFGVRAPCRLCVRAEPARNKCQCSGLVRPLLVIGFAVTLSAWQLSSQDHAAFLLHHGFPSRITSAREYGDNRRFACHCKLTDCSRCFRTLFRQHLKVRKQSTSTVRVSADRRYSKSFRQRVL